MAPFLTPQDNAKRQEISSYAHLLKRHKPLRKANTTRRKTAGTAEKPTRIQIPPYHIQIPCSSSRVYIYNPQNCY